MKQPLRIGQASGIDMERPLRFSFDGQDYSGYAGDTLATDVFVTNDNEDYEAVENTELQSEYDYRRVGLLD